MLPKPEPLMVTVVPGNASAGVNDDMEGGGKKLKPAEDAVPPGVVTERFPLAPAPTMAVMLLAELTVKELAGSPPKSTAVAPVKLLPLMVTVVPVPPVCGVKELICGCGMYVNPALEALP